MAPVRDFTITYGSQTIGGTGASITYPIVGKVATTENNDLFTCRFSFLVIGTGPSDFEGNLATVRSAFRKPNQNFTMVVGDTQTNDTWYSFNHGTGTGFDSTAEIEKEESDEDSGLVQRLTVRVEIQLPADTLGSANGQLGRRSSTVTVDKAASGRRTLTIDGVYTATTTQTTAIAQYESSIAAYVAAVQSAVDSAATWELVSEFTDVVDSAVSSVSPASHFGKGKVCTFRREYEELLFQQGSTASTASPNDSEIIKQRFRIASEKHNRDDPGELAVGTELDKALINYTCEVDTSLTGTSLVDKYETDIRAFLYDEARALLGLRSLTIFTENVEYNVDTNEISVFMQIGGVITSQLDVAVVDIEDAFPDTGEKLVPIWGGDPLQYFDFQGPAVRTRTIHIEEEVPNITTENPLPSGAFVNPPNGKVLSTKIRNSPRQLVAHFGESDPRFRRTRRVTDISIQYFLPPGQEGEVGQDLDDIQGILEPGGGGFGL